MANRPHQSPWTPENTALLTTMYPDPTFTFLEIMQAFGGFRSLQSIQCKAINLGFTLRKLSRSERDAAEDIENKRRLWPEDMPSFEDHPDAAKQTRGGNARRHAARVMPDKAYQPSDVGGGTGQMAASSHRRHGTS